MRTSFIMALLAAAAIVPTAASAQDWHRGEGGHGGRDGGRPGGQPQQHQQQPQPQAPQRPVPQSQPAQAPTRTFNGGGDHGRVYFPGGRPQFQGQPPQQQQPPAQARPPFQPNGGNPNAAQGWQQRGGDHRGGGTWQGQGQGQAQGRPNTGGDWRDRGQRGNGGDWRDRDQRNNGGDWRNRDPRNNSGDWRNRDQHNNGGDWRDRDRRNNGGDWRDRGRDGRGGGWNRDWHRDNRYNWSERRAHNRNAFHLPRYYAPYGWDYGYRRFGIGFALSSILYEQNYWIDDPGYYGLPEAYGPYRWVRYYNDALLVDIYTGEVVDTVYDIFW